MQDPAKGCCVRKSSRKQLALPWFPPKLQILLPFLFAGKGLSAELPQEREVVLQKIPSGTEFMELLDFPSCLSWPALHWEKGSSLEPLDAAALLIHAGD